MTRTILGFARGARAVTGFRADTNNDHVVDEPDHSVIQHRVDHPEMGLGAGLGRSSRQDQLVRFCVIWRVVLCG